MKKLLAGCLLAVSVCCSAHAMEDRANGLARLVASGELQELTNEQMARLDRALFVYVPGTGILKGLLIPIEYAGRFCKRCGEKGAKWAAGIGIVGGGVVAIGDMCLFEGDDVADQRRWWEIGAVCTGVCLYVAHYFLYEDGVGNELEALHDTLEHWDERKEALKKIGLLSEEICVRVDAIVEQYQKVKAQSAYDANMSVRGLAEELYKIIQGYEKRVVPVKRKKLE